MSQTASSHRERLLMIAADPLADNTDLYAFRSPDDTNTITIIANYIPFESPQGGPNWYTFGENIRYEIHIKNNASTTGDDMPPIVSRLPIQMLKMLYNLLQYPPGKAEH